MLPRKGDEGKNQKGSCRYLFQMLYRMYLRPGKSIFIAEENAQIAKGAWLGGAEPLKPVGSRRVQQTWLMACKRR